MSDPIVKIDPSNLLFFDDVRDDQMSEAPAGADSPETFTRRFHPNQMAMVGGKGTVTFSSSFSDEDL